MKQPVAWVGSAHSAIASKAVMGQAERILLAFTKLAAFGFGCALMSPRPGFAGTAHPTGVRGIARSEGPAAKLALDFLARDG
jgi:hypothetical protein